MEENHDNGHVVTMYHILYAQSLLEEAVVCIEEGCKKIPMKTRSFKAFEPSSSFKH